MMTKIPFEVSKRLEDTHKNGDELTEYIDTVHGFQGNSPLTHSLLELSFGNINLIFLSM